jgi:hypothetical protein
METLEIPKDVWIPISSLVRHGIYKNEKSALVNIIHDMSLSKIKELESGIKEFEVKYKIDFEGFQSKINEAKRENFEKWDDYIEWKAYFTAYNHWKSIHEESSRWL